MVVVLAGAAWFVLPSTVGATPLPDTVTDTGVTAPVEDAVEETLPDAGATTAPVEDTVEETLPDAGGITQPIEDTVEETLPDTGGTTDPIEDVTGPVKETAGSAEGTVNEVVDEVTGPIGDSVDETATGTSIDSSKSNGGRKRTGSGGFVSDRALAERFSHEISGVLSSAGNPERVLRIAPSSAPTASGPSLIEEIVGAALDAAKKIAFPLALALLAGAFIVVQGRIDRRDPKLAAAPVEIDEQLLRFE